MNKIINKGGKHYMLVDVDGEEQIRDYHTNWIEGIVEYVPDTKSNEKIIAVLGSNTYKIITI